MGSVVKRCGVFPQVKKPFAAKPLACESPDQFYDI